MPIPKPLSVGEETFAMHMLLLGLAPVREYQLHPSRKWRLDFAWPEFKLAVEIEGGLHSNGRHQRKDGYSADMEKYNALTMAGWRLLRYSPAMVTRGDAIDDIRALLGRDSKHRAQVACVSEV